MPTCADSGIVADSFGGKGNPELIVQRSFFSGYTSYGFRYSQLAGSYTTTVRVEESDAAGTTWTTRHAYPSVSGGYSSPTNATDPDDGLGIWIDTPTAGMTQVRVTTQYLGGTWDGISRGARIKSYCNPPPPPCQYGTELTIPGTFIYYLTPAVIDALLVEVGALPLAPLFTAFWFAAVDMRELCSGLPPPVPTIDVSVFTWSPAALYGLLHSLAWWYFCKCSSGATTPVSPTKPVVPTPPGMPTQPTFPCDPAALCAALVTIQRQLAALSATVGLDYNADTLMQRYALPFAFIPGAAHTVAGTSGSLPVSRLVGMRAELLSAPPSFVLEGTPPYLWDLGWMSISDGGAMLQEKRITRTSMDWTPQGMQLATTFGWYAKPGVSLKFTELRAEP